MAPGKRKAKTRLAAKNVKQPRIEEKVDSGKEVEHTAARSDDGKGGRRTPRGGRSRPITHSTPGKNYTSHFRPDTMVTGSSPSLLDLTVTYDYTTDVTSVDSNAPRPSIQQLTQLFPFQDNSKTVSSTSNVLSILHELSPAHSAPPTKRTRLRPCKKSTGSGCTKLDILLTQLQQRVSANNLQGTGCHGDTDPPENPPEEVVKESHSESSDDEGVLFWTQAATQLDFNSSNYRGSPQSKDNCKSTVGASVDFDLNSDADDFIDQLLMTGTCTEGETPQNLPAKVAHPLDPPDLLNFPLPVTANETLQCNERLPCHTQAGCHDNDRCPTPPLPSEVQRPQSHNHRHLPVASLKTKHRPTTNRPPTLKLVEEDAKLTPPISPMLSEPTVKFGPQSPNCNSGNSGEGEGKKRGNICLNEQGVKVSSFVSANCSGGEQKQLCSKDEIEHKRRLARLKLARKKNAPLS